LGPINQNTVKDVTVGIKDKFNTELIDLVGSVHIYKAIVNKIDIEGESLLLYTDYGWILFIEDDNDGYRSSCSAPIFIQGYDDVIKRLFNIDAHNEPYIRRQCSFEHTSGGSYDGDDADILILRDDLTGQELCRVGTDNISDYYPSMVLNWTPNNLEKHEKTAKVLAKLTDEEQFRGE